MDRSNDEGVGDIWVFGIADGSSSRVSFQPRNETTAVWSPDGDEVAYIEDTGSALALVRKRLDGRPGETLHTTTLVLTCTHWSPDGRHLLIDRYSGKTSVDVVAWSFEKRAMVELSATAATEASAVFSPDGRWFAYHSDESGQFEIYVQPFPPTGAKYQVSTAGGISPRWRRDEISYVDAAHRLQVAKVESTPRFRTAAPEPLFLFDPRMIAMQFGIGAQYDVLPDGNFLVTTPIRTPPKPMKLLVNWQQRLETAGASP